MLVYHREVVTEGSWRGHLVRTGSDYKEMGLVMAARSTICSHPCFGDEALKLGTAFVTLNRSYFFFFFFWQQVSWSVKWGDGPGLIQGVFMMTVASPMALGERLLSLPHETSGIMPIHGKGPVALLWPLP